MFDLIGLVAAAVMTCTANTAVCPPGPDQAVATTAIAEPAPAVQTPADTQITETPIVEPPRQKPAVAAERKAPKAKLVSTAKPAVRTKVALKRKVEIPVIIGGYF